MSWSGHDPATHHPPEDASSSGDLVLPLIVVAVGMAVIRRQLDTDRALNLTDSPRSPTEHRVAVAPMMLRVDVNQVASPDLVRR